MFFVLFLFFFGLSQAVALRGTAFYSKPNPLSPYGEDVFAAYSVNDQGQLKLNEEIPLVPMNNRPLNYFHVHFSAPNGNTDQLHTLQCDTYGGENCDSSTPFQTQTYTISNNSLNTAVPVVFDFNGTVGYGLADVFTQATSDGISYALFSSGFNISGLGNTAKIFSFDSAGNTKLLYTGELPDTVSSYSSAMSPDEKTLFFVYESNSFEDPNTLSGQGIFLDLATGEATPIDYSFPIVNFTVFDDPVITGPNQALLRRRSLDLSFAEFVPLTEGGAQTPIQKLPVAQFTVSMRGAVWDTSSSTYYTGERLDLAWDKISKDYTFYGVSAKNGLSSFNIEVTSDKPWILDTILQVSAD